MFFEVRCEESRRLVMIGKMNLGNTIENSTFVASINASRTAIKKPHEMSRVWCDHCNKPWHTRETRWKIHRKPANWKGFHEGRFTCTPAAHEVEFAPFNKEQMDHLLKLMKSNSGLLSTPNAFIAQAGSELNALSCYLLVYYTPWIINLEASDHMTSFSYLFHTYTPYSDHEKVCIADGSYSPIVGNGLINLFKTISLKNVLYVPKLTGNLLSVSKLSRDFNNRAIFFFQIPWCLSGTKLGEDD